MAPTRATWFLAATAPVPGFAAAQVAGLAPGGSGPYVYTTGAGHTATPDAVVWTAGPDVPTTVRVTADEVAATVSPMNELPLYLVKDRFHGRILICGDAFVAASAAAAWGLPAAAVRQLEPASAVWICRSGRGWQTTGADLPDPLDAGYAPSLADAEAAGDAFVAALSGAVAGAVDPGRPVAVMLSGGIDSGAVTTLAHRAGLSVTAYSAGTPWGDEHDDAAELTSHLGIDHVRLALTADELLAAVPEAIRMLGGANAEKVDIALTAVAMLRGGAIAPDQILTGYGSDLLNLGLPVHTDDPAAMISLMMEGLDDTRHSGELSPAVAASRGRRLIHPYWHPDVIAAALAVHPLCKVAGGREKAYFRAAMGKLLPDRIAWRAKIAVHHGGGLQSGLDELFGGRAAKIEAYRECEAAVAAQLREDPLAGPDHPAAVELLRARVRATARG